MVETIEIVIVANSINNTFDRMEDFPRTVPFILFRAVATMLELLNRNRTTRITMLHD